jgi:hypothetical protein
MADPLGFDALHGFMPMKGDGAGDPREANRWDGGVVWIAYPEEGMQRASVALESDGDVYLVDPVDVDGVEEIYGDLGTVAGVVVGLDRHKRDAAALANRHDVPVFVPEFMRKSVEDDLQARVEGFRGELPGTDYRAIEVLNNRFWREAALYDPEEGTLVVPEAVGTAEYFLAGGERLGVHPMLRSMPPRRALGDLSPDRVLVGHGVGVEDDATEALRDALAGSRRRMPSLYAGIARSALPF